MMSNNEFIELANSFPDIEEMPHFDRLSFRIKKRVFATLNIKESRACIKLSENDQYIFCLNENVGVYPVPNKWGLQGWTNIELSKISKKLLKEILKTSYIEVTLKK